MICYLVLMSKIPPNYQDDYWGRNYNFYFSPENNDRTNDALLHTYILPCLIQSQLRNAPNNETKNRAPNRIKYISNRLFSLIASKCSPNHINSPKKDSHMRMFGPINSHRNPLSFMIVLPSIFNITSFLTGVGTKFGSYPVEIQIKKKKKYTLNIKMMDFTKFF